LKEVKTSDDWENLLKEDKPVILQASASWCRPCQVLKPILEKKAGEHKGEFIFYYMDVEKMSNVARML